MTDWGPSDDRWFRSGRQHKHDSLRRLLADLPGLSWTLSATTGSTTRRSTTTWPRSTRTGSGWC